MIDRARLLCTLTVFALAAAGPAWAAEAPGEGGAASSLRRAEVLLQQKHYRKAAAELERASVQTPGPCPGCLLGVGRVYRAAGQVDAALQVTRMALALLSAPADRARAYEQLGSLLALKGDLEAAQEAYGKAVALDAGLERQVRSQLVAALNRQAAAAASQAAEEGSLAPASSGGR